MNRTQAQTKTNAQCVKEHRQRKRNGLTQYKVELSPEQIDTIQRLSAGLENKTRQALVKFMLETAFARFTASVTEGKRLVELGVSQDVIDAYSANEGRRITPLTAEQFLAGER